MVYNIFVQWKAKCLQIIKLVTAKYALFPCFLQDIKIKTIDRDLSVYCDLSGIFYEAQKQACLITLFWHVAHS